MTEKSETAAAETDYSATLFLPDTQFPMRAGLPAREPGWLQRWEDMDIYRMQRKQAEGRPVFTLHDGPPYANGNIHIGHALNKTLKDLVTRSMQMLGYDAAYVPGWDCHGLPIEWKIEEQYRAKGKNKDDVPVIEFRQECRTFAQHWVDVQREEFKRLGILGNWDNPYLTMSFDAEAQIARELMKFAATGQLYRGSKPVMWSVVERTALAEAEIEYADYESDTIWVKFPVRSGGGEITSAAFHDLNASVVIWTTTPWTIPANRAISFSSKIAYGLYEVIKAPEGNWASVGEKYILADKLAGEVFAKGKVEEFARIGDVDPAHITSCFHPLRGLDGGYEFEVPLLAGEHVTDDAGTGFVHTAPGHGLDDFGIWMDYATRGKQIAREARNLVDAADLTPSDQFEQSLEERFGVPFIVDDAGYYTDKAPGFSGARVIDDAGKKGDANNRVIAALAERHAMVARGRVKHSYPHSWRSKKPIIYRNTPQWFVYMDKPITEQKVDVTGSHITDGSRYLVSDTLRNRAMKAIAETRFVPAAGQNRLRSMVESKPDWVLSRQRAWGVPISVFFNIETGEVLNDPAVNARIADAFEAEGADAWYHEGSKARFLGTEHDHAAYQQVGDILDVWFDSGSTHAFVLENKKKWPELKWPASVYLEGSDQHRGFFQSSLLESCGTRGRAPYDTVVTHGFTMDGEGRKMSKSLGNTVAPQDIIKQYGADILRLWVASTDYSEDQRLGKEIIQTTVDSYRKLRNTLRWLLGNLAHYQPEDVVAFADMPEIEQLMLHRLHSLDKVVRQAYLEFDYRKITAALANFMNIELSAFYFDIRKDALYCDPISSVRRRASLTVLNQLFDCLTAWLAPILVFTMEEVWLERHPGETSSVHLRQFPEIPAEWENEALATKWQKIRTVRRVVTGALEIERREKRIGSSLEAAPKVFITDAALLEALQGQDVADIAITSDIEVIAGEGPSEAFRLDDIAGVSVLPALADGQRCARSWKVLPEVGSDPEFPDLTLRDAQAMRERQAAGLAA